VSIGKTTSKLFWRVQEVMNKNEILLVEAVKTMLQQDAKLGLSIHEKDPYISQFDAERGMEHLHGHINEMFQLKAAELTHADGVSQAFHKVHSYKYVDDPAFATAMEKEMVAQAVPAEERSKALKFVTSIIKELREDQKEWAEKDSGFNPELDEIRKISNIEQPTEFEIHDKDGYNKSNVKSKVGEANPSRTPNEPSKRL